MAKLNQIIAIEKGIKSRNYSKVGEIHKQFQKVEPFNGFVKNYQKLNEEGEDLPQERKQVQFKAKEMLAEVEKLSTEWMDITARKEWTNCTAKANIEVDGHVIFHDVPVTYLLFLEKQLTDMRTLIDSMVTLDESEIWHEDTASGLYRSQTVQTHRTKKVQKSLVLLQPTEHHPGQAQMITEDVLVGHWHTQKHSGAIPKTRKQAIAEKVEKLLQAVKQAREAANAIDEVSTPQVGQPFFDYLFRH